MKLTADQREALAAFLLERYRAWTVEKTDVTAIVVVARVFGVLRLLGVNVPSEGDFMERFWTTLGPVVFAPRGTGLLGWMGVSAHVPVGVKPPSTELRAWLPIGVDAVPDRRSARRVRVLPAPAPGASPQGLALSTGPRRG